MEAYFEALGMILVEIVPISRELYLEYASLYETEKQIEVLPTFVETLESRPDG